MTRQDEKNNTIHKKNKQEIRNMVRTINSLDDNHRCCCICHPFFGSNLLAASSCCVSSLSIVSWSWSSYRPAAADEDRSRHSGYDRRVVENIVDASDDSMNHHHHLSPHQDPSLNVWYILW
mmetsp:Transcript_25457/g.27309  ORF Transcript_25457/g.27309 Transcript_25457/m.27309 type:complete len:121 (-) Transcript_25457:1-363(-)